MYKILLLMTLSFIATAGVPTRIIILVQDSAHNQVINNQIPKADLENILFYSISDTQVSTQFDPLNDVLKSDTAKFGLELGLAISISKEYPKEKFLIIKYSKNSSAVNDGWWNFTDSKYHTDLEKSVSEALSLARNSGYEPDVRALLWLHNESDFKNVKNYHEVLPKFLNQMRFHFSSTMAFAVPGSELKQLESKNSEQIIKAFQDISKVELVNEALSTNNQILDLGQKYGEAILKHLEARAVFKLWPNNPPNDWKRNDKEIFIRNGGTSRYKCVGESMITFYPAKQKNGPVVLICPGGGYGLLAYDKEGTEFAEYFNKQGINAFLLKYRLPKSGDVRHVPALQDAQRALSIIRANAKNFGYDENKIGMMGFSAGGHLTAVTSNAKERTYSKIDEIDNFSFVPNFSVLIYPAYLSKDGKLLPPLEVTSTTPPTFLMHAKDDKSYYFNSPVYVEELKKAKVKFSFFDCATGGHGHGLRKIGKESDGFMDSLIKWINELYL